jgi:hypothetical protein
MSMTRAPSQKPLMAAPVSSLGRLGSWSYRANWWFPRWLDRIMPSFLTEVGSTELDDNSPA